MSVVLGLDLSLTNTGIAHWRNGEITTLSMPLNHKPKNYRERNRRIVAMARAVIRTIDPTNQSHPYDLVVLEGPILHGRILPSYFDRAQVWGGVFSQLMLWGLPTAVIDPKTLKMWAVNNGNADKKLMHAAASEWCTPRNHDEADAVWLACFGAFYLEDPMPFPLTGRHTAGLERVEWPTDQRNVR